MRLYQRIRWTCGIAPGVHTTHELLGGWVSIDRHFKGCGRWTIEGVFAGWPWCGLRLYKKLGRSRVVRWSITLRMPGPFITVGQPYPDRWRTVRVIGGKP